MYIIQGHTQIHSISKDGIRQGMVLNATLNNRPFSNKY